MRLSVWAGSLALVMLGTQAGWEPAAQQTIPDAPKPQPTLPDLRSVAPGRGATSSSDDTADSTAKQPAAARTPAAPTAPAGAPTGSTLSNQPAVYAGDIDAPASDGEEAIHTLYMHVDAVDVAFTVKDSKGHLVPGLEPRDVQVYENGLRQHIEVFTNDALPMSVAIT